jgi:hypothetical protein
VTLAAAHWLRTFAFGDLETAIWGVAASAGSTTVASFATEITADSAGDAADDEWFLAAGGLELRFAPLAEPAALGPAAAGIDGFAQLCSVDGVIHRDGAEREVSCLGTRGGLASPSPPSPPSSGSVRTVSGWFGPDYGFAVAALRPPRASGHDKDAVACAIVDGGAALAIDEPRLSTAYDADGHAARASLEVWLEDLHVEDGEDRPQYPRRFAGEATGERTRIEVAGAELDAALFRWHARGVEGAGVYVLVRPR